MLGVDASERETMKTEEFEVRIGMIFQIKKGDVVEGSIPFRVMSKSWVPKGGWIMESMFGKLEHVTTEALESKWTRNFALEYGEN